MSIKLRLDYDDQGSLSLKATAVKGLTGGGRVARTEDVTDLLTTEQVKAMSYVLKPVIDGVTASLKKKLMVDEMEQVLSKAKSGDPRLAKLSLEGAVGLDGNSTTG